MARRATVRAALAGVAVRGAARWPDGRIATMASSPTLTTPNGAAASVAAAAAASPEASACLGPSACSTTLDVFDALTSSLVQL